MTRVKAIAGLRRLRAVRLRPETASGEALGAMARHLSLQLGMEHARALEVLLRMGRPKSRPA